MVQGVRLIRGRVAFKVGAGAFPQQSLKIFPEKDSGRNCRKREPKRP